VCPPGAQKLITAIYFMSCRVSPDYVYFGSYVLHLSHLIAILLTRLSIVDNTYFFGSNPSLSAKMISLFSLTISVFQCLPPARQTIGCPRSAQNQFWPRFLGSTRLSQREAQTVRHASTSSWSRLMHGQAAIELLAPAHLSRLSATQMCDAVCATQCSLNLPHSILA
jgi:hypothetical protein